MNLFPPLEDLKREMAAAIEHGRANRAAEILTDARGRWPFLSALVASVFTGTPEEVVRKASVYWPGLADMPGAVEFARAVQEKLQEAASKKRGAQPAPEGRRLKG